jgi:Flp pilus assembly protein TadB
MSANHLSALLPLLLPPLAAIAVYLLITAFFGGDPVKKKIRNRLSALSGRADLDNTHDDVMKEKRKSDRRSKKQSKLISKRFEDSLVASGIKLTGKEYLFVWIGMTTLPVAILSALAKASSPFWRRDHRLRLPAVSGAPRQKKAAAAL